MRTRATTTRIIGTAALGLLIAATAACGGDDGGTAATTTSAPAGADISGKDFKDETGSAAVEVDAIDNTFKAPYIEIKKGTKVTFRNDGRNTHDVYPVIEGAFPEIPTEKFEPKMEASVTFDEAGDFPYYCTLHGTKTKGMVGGIRVVP